MKENHKIYLLTLIFVSLTIIRFKINSLGDEIINSIMACVNIIALVFIVSLIAYRAYKRISNKSDEISQKIPNCCSDDIIINYKEKVFLFMICMIILSTIYILYLKNVVMNDIITIAALIISVEDETFINKLTKVNIHKIIQ